MLALLLVSQMLFHQFGFEFAAAAKLFFGLSLPWLISPVVVAWWALRRNNNTNLSSSAIAQ
jgi:hypothetical protein